MHCWNKQKIHLNKNFKNVNPFKICIIVNKCSQGNGDWNCVPGVECFI